MNSKELLFKLIAKEIFGKEMEPFSLKKEEMEELHELAVSHDMGHIVGVALDKLGMLPRDGLGNKFRQHVMICSYRYGRLEHEMKGVTETFEEEGIDYLPLKGAVIRRMYSSPWMRTSCDIDVLVKKEDVERASLALKKRLGYVKQKTGRHDVTFLCPSGLAFELHYDLIESDSVARADEALQDVWEKSSLVHGTKHRYEMSAEMFYYYHVAHMAKHFVQGGCGVRPFLDLLVLEKELDKNDEITGNLLESGGILTFRDKALRLAKVWFLGEEKDDLTEEMTSYVTSGGTYGNMTNRVAVAQVREGGKIKYILSRIWLPYERLKFHYPSLERRRWLLPFYEIRRWGKLAFCGGFKRSKNEIALTKNTSGETVDRVKALMDELGL